MSPPASSAILIIDDHALLLEGLSVLLTQELPGIQVVTAASIQEALQQTASPAAIMVDIKLPGLNGLDGLTLLRKRWPQASLAILSAQDDARTREEAGNRGVVCFLSKADSSARVASALRELLGRSERSTSPAAPGPGERSFLTARQCEVLELLCNGLSNKHIARVLNLSDNTIRRHVQDILTHFGVSNRTEAVFEARRRGYVR